MLHFMIVVINMRNTSAGGEPAALGELRPLNARSLILSALLGTHPPRLPARSLVAFGGLFGIAGGTMRTALSRLTAAGELESDDSWYQLTSPLVDRQRSQDAGRRPPSAPWDGTWYTAISLDDQRTVADRRRDRRRLADHRLGELRPDIWMRPANLAAPQLGTGWSVVAGPISGIDDDALVRRLWDLDAIAATARRLGDLLRTADAPDSTDVGESGEVSGSGEVSRSGDTGHTGDTGEFATIPRRFEIAATVLRFLRNEPLLPAELVGADWPVDGLRRDYATSEAALQHDLRRFYRQA